MSQTNHPSPWLTMWTQPRETIRGIVHANPRYGVLWLSTVYVLQSLFFILNFQSFGLSFSLASILVPVLVIAPIFAVVWVFFYGWILYITGRWLGGMAPRSHLRTALAWSKIPMVIALVMWFFLLIANPDYVFIQYVGGPSAFFVNLILFILEIWAFVLFVQAVREVQHFSVLRALANIFISAVFYSIIVFGLLMFARFLYLI
ncbi:MAG: YIP1 family protein [Verrucomicrobia bacterium]|nr:YIP1 family protein [Verrucomicrobiota bacterium]